MTPVPPPSPDSRPQPSLGGLGRKEQWEIQSAQKMGLAGDPRTSGRAEQRKAEFKLSLPPHRVPYSYTDALVSGRGGRVDSTREEGLCGGPFLGPQSPPLQRLKIPSPAARLVVQGD